MQKQPDADTLKLDRRINSVLDELQLDLPEHTVIERRIFKQADFIEAAVANVIEAIRDGAMWVVVVLFIFMWNFRTSICRRRKENRQLPIPEDALKVIYDASCEVRNSIVYATFIVVLVVFPLFSMAGLEGRMFAPLGVAYTTSLLASLLVSLTLTPVLASYLLPRARFLDRKGDPFVLQFLKKATEAVLRWTLRHVNSVLAATVVMVAVAMLSLFWMGGEFLPPFNIPLAALGSVIALLIVYQPSAAALQAADWWEWPRVWISATSLSVAHWVGFITLIGVVSRNGIMMISHYIHLMEHEGESFGEAMIIRGSLERQSPVIMTAATSFFGLLPLLFGAGQTGREILYPVALVVFGGMLTSTMLDHLVTPALFLKFGRNVHRVDVQTDLKA